MGCADTTNLNNYCRGFEIFPCLTFMITCVFVVLYIFCYTTEMDVGV